MWVLAGLEGERFMSMRRGRSGESGVIWYAQRVGVVGEGVEICCFLVSMRNGGTVKLGLTGDFDAVDETIELLVFDLPPL